MKYLLCITGLVLSTTVLWSQNECDDFQVNVWHICDEQGGYDLFYEVFNAVPPLSINGDLQIFLEELPEGEEFLSNFDTDGGPFNFSFTDGRGCEVDTLSPPISCKELETIIVDLIVTASDETNLVQWHTATENETSHFILKRSFDGVNFEEIAQTAGANLSLDTLSYEYVDTELITGTTFYKLCWVDLNGEVFEHDKVVTVVRGDGTAGDEFIFDRILLDEDGRSVRLVVYSPQDQAIQFEVYDVSGRLFAEESLAVKEGFQVLTPSDASIFAHGFYVFRIRAGEETYTKHFYKHRQ